MADQPGIDALTLAQRCAEAMWAADAASRALGLELVDVRPGQAVVAMTVTDRMVNGHGLCHGGYIFALADSAFAVASNTYNRRTVAHHCSVTFVRPSKSGDRLLATAAERVRTSRSGIYDITITTADGGTIAEFRGHSRTIDGTLL